MALTGLAVLLVVVLAVIGVRALLASQQVPESAPMRAGTTGTPAAERTPTLRIQCVADTCPSVTVRVPGGDVLHVGDMTLGEEYEWFEDEIDVVLNDAGTVEVVENGVPRSPGEPGERESFTVKRS